MTTVSTGGLPGYTTYQVTLTPNTGKAHSIYTIYGEPDHALEIPPARQVATPFGADVGGVNPAFYAINAECEYDSWLSVGITEGNDSGYLSSIGIPFDAWSEEPDGALTVDDGAVFWMVSPRILLSLVVAFPPVSAISWRTGPDFGARRSGCRRPVHHADACDMARGVQLPGKGECRHCGLR